LDTNIGDTTLSYTAKKVMKKRKPKIPNLDQKRIQNQIWKVDHCGCISRLGQYPRRLIASISRLGI